MFVFIGLIIILVYFICGRFCWIIQILHSTQMKKRKTEKKQKTKLRTITLIHTLWIYVYKVGKQMVSWASPTLGTNQSNFFDTMLRAIFQYLIIIFDFDRFPFELFTLLLPIDFFHNFFRSTMYTLLKHGPWSFSQ